MKLNPYIAFDGTCAEALRFYGRTIGAELLMLMTYGESPMADQVPPESRGHVMHAQVRIGDAVVMASDDRPGHYRPMTGFNLSLTPETLAEAERVFAALSEGGTVRMPLQPTFWSPGFAMLSDRFGIPWMINTAPSP